MISSFVPEIIATMREQIESDFENQIKPTLVQLRNRQNKAEEGGIAALIAPEFT